MSEGQGGDPEPQDSTTAFAGRGVLDEPISAARATPEETFWLALDSELKKGGITKVEDAAKQLITVTSISQSIYFAAVSFSETKKSLPLIPFPPRMWFVFALILPLILWSGGLYNAIRAFKPEEYLTNQYAPDIIESTYKEILKFKTERLDNAYRLLGLGFLVALVVLLIYLFAVPSLPPAKP
jgi:hypothetical protein